MAFNISDPEANETCSYIKEGNSSHSEDHHEGEDDHDHMEEDDHDHMEEDDHDHVEEDDHDHDEEEVSPFCANMYSMIREMVLTLNYTTQSCLINGTTSSSTGDPEATPTRSDPGLGVFMITYEHVWCVDYMFMKMYFCHVIL